MRVAGFTLWILAFFAECRQDYDAFNEDDHPNGHLKYFKASSGCNERICKKEEKQQCWGYEDDCQEGIDFSYPECKYKGYKHSLKEQQREFWEQCDFGYVKKYLKTLQILCEPKNQNGSSLKCDPEWEYCEAKNLYLDFTKKEFDGTDRYPKSFLIENEIGGSECILKKTLMREKENFPGELNSWNSDLRHYKKLDKKKICDVTIDMPVIFMKLDSGVNLYHHFCDFLNLYVSQHIKKSFSKDVFIIFWDPTNLPYMDLFEETWKAFTRHETRNLIEFKGKRVCVQDVVFSLPPRMQFGLYYNTPFAKSCSGCKLFEAFNEHLIHRLGIRQDKIDEDEIRVTLLMRSTTYRKILNQEELIGAMKRVKGLNVTAVDYQYKSIPFLKQIQISHNTDILIGMHGAGLTHLLFQPHWGAVFEIYNTEDPDCYKDLARIRGIDYYTWENYALLHQQDKGHHPQIGEHPKFTNYAFNVNEFMRVLTKAAKSVLRRRQVYGR